MSSSIIDLQIKLAYLEDTLDALNAVIAKQDRQIQDLQDQLKIIYRRLESKDDGISPFDVLADKPPHY